jgi:MFS family permease
MNVFFLKKILLFITQLNPSVKPSTSEGINVCVRSSQSISKKNKFPWWVIIIVLIFLAAIAVIVVAFWRKRKKHLSPVEKGSSRFSVPVYIDELKEKFVLFSLLYLFYKYFIFFLLLFEYVSENENYGNGLYLTICLFISLFFFFIFYKYFLFSSYIYFLFYLVGENDLGNNEYAEDKFANIEMENDEDKEDAQERLEEVAKAQLTMSFTPTSESEYDF